MTRLRILLRQIPALLWKGIKKMLWFQLCWFAALETQLFIMAMFFSAWASYHAGHPLTQAELWSVFDRLMSNIFAKGGCTQ